MVGGLLTGSQLPANFNKRCMRADGDIVAVNVQMSCVWSEGAPKYFVCYVRRRDGDANGLGIPAQPQARLQMINSSDSEVFSNASQSPCPREFSLEGDENGNVKMEDNYPSFSALGIESPLGVGN